MKRRIIVLIAGFVVVLFFILFAGGGGSQTAAPRFIRGKPASIGPFVREAYNWDVAAPFEDGKVWLWTAARTNTHLWFYDLDHREIIGELANGGCPQLWCPQNSRVLCEGRDSAAASWKRKLVEWFARATGHQAPQANRTETYWILDLKSQEAVKVGSIEQYPGTGSGWSASPDFRYGYTRPTTAGGQWFALCDLREKTFVRITFAAQPIGWWSEHEILAADGPNVFGIFDLAGHTTRRLFGPDDIAKFLTDAGLAAPAGGLEALPNWNGRSYDFYLGPKGRLRGLGDTNAFLLKLDRNGPSLKLAWRKFEPRWGGNLDADGTYYLYQGESGAPGNGGNGAVYVRNLTSDAVTTIVSPDGSQQYAIPKFYGPEIIYFNKGLMHRVGIDGDNDVPILQPVVENLP